MMGWRGWRRGAVVALLLGALNGCGESNAGAKQPGSAPRAAGQLTIGVNQFPPNLHPGIEPSAVKTYINSAAYRQLTVWNPDFELECLLCVTVPTLENGLAKVTNRPDGTQGMTLRYQIKPDLFWGDGVPVTTDDIIFSHMVGSRDDTGYSTPDSYKAIERVEKIDDKNFIFHLRATRYDYNGLTFFTVPAHLERPVFDGLENKTEYGRNSIYNKQPTNPGLYNGPYIFGDVVSGAYISMIPNPYWKGQKPAFDKITVRAIDNSAALEQNLLSGDLDFIAGEVGLQLDQALALQRREPARFNYLYVAGLVYDHIDLNLDNPILADVRVRRALIMSVDRERINEKLTGGKNQVAHVFKNPNDRGYDPNVRKYPFDMKAAAALLEEAGWKMADDGIRRNADGKKLTLEFNTSAGNRNRELIQQVLMSKWREIGIEIIPKNAPGRTLFGQLLRRREFTGMALYSWTSQVEASPSQILSEKSIPTEATGWAGSNYTGWRGAEKEAVITAINTTLDVTERNKLWARLQDMYTSEVPVLPLFYRTDPHVLPKWLDGYRPAGHNQPVTTWIEEWKVVEVTG